MGGDNEDDDVLAKARKMPLASRASHKNWKVKEDVFRELARELSQASEGDALFTECSAFLPKAIKDSNAAAQLAALLALSRFAEQAPDEIVRGMAAFCGRALAENAFAGRPTNRKQALEALISIVYADCGDLVIDALIAAGYGHKNPKVISACIDATRDCLAIFGSKAVPVQVIACTLPTLLEHSNANVRSSTKSLAADLLQALGPRLLAALKNVKEVTIKEIEAINAQSSQRPSTVQHRCTRKVERQRLAAANLGGEVGDDESGEGMPSDGADEGSTNEQIDMRQEIALEKVLGSIRVEVEEGLQVDWQKAIHSTKWAARKTALTLLSSELDGKKLASVDGLEALCVKLRQVLNKDANVMVATAAATTVATLGRAVRTDFPSTAIKGLCVSLLSKLKDRNRALTDAVGSALLTLHAEQCFQSTKEIMDDIQSAAQGKVPKARIETLTWIRKCLESRPSTAAEAVKELCGLFVKSADDSQAEVRDLGLRCLALMVVRFGERATKSFVSQMDKIRQDKVSEYEAELRANKQDSASGPPPAGAETLTPRAVTTQTTPRKPRHTNGKEAMEQRHTPSSPGSTQRATETSLLRKARTPEGKERPEPAESRTSPSKAGARGSEVRLESRAADVKTFVEVRETAREVSPHVEPVACELLPVGDDRAQAVLSAMVPGIELSALESRSAAGRKQVVDAVLSHCRDRSEGDLSTEQTAAVLTAVRLYAGLSDTNANVLNAKLELVECALRRAAKPVLGAYTGELVKSTAEEIAGKLGDFRSGKPASKALKSMAKVFSPRSLVLDACLTLGRTAVNPKTTIGLCEFTKALLLDAPRGDPVLDRNESIADLVSLAASNDAQAVSTAGVQLAAAYDVQRGGDRIFTTGLGAEERHQETYQRACLKYQGVQMDAACGGQERDKEAESAPEGSDAVLRGSGSTAAASASPEDGSEPPIASTRSSGPQISVAVPSLRSVSGEGAERNEGEVVVETERSSSQVETSPGTQSGAETTSSTTSIVTKASTERKATTPPALPSGSVPCAWSSKPDDEADQSGGKVGEIVSEDSSPPGTVPEDNSILQWVTSVRSSSDDVEKLAAIDRLGRALMDGPCCRDEELQSIVDITIGQLADPVRKVRLAAFQLLVRVMCAPFESEAGIAEIFRGLGKKPAHEVAVSCLQSLLSTSSGGDFVCRHAKQALLEEKAVVKKELLDLLLLWARSPQTCTDLVAGAEAQLSSTVTLLRNDKSASVRLQSSRLLEALDRTSFAARSRQRASPSAKRKAPAREKEATTTTAVATERKDRAPGAADATTRRLREKGEVPGLRGRSIRAATNPGAARLRRPKTTSSSSLAAAAPGVRKTMQHPRVARLLQSLSLSENVDVHNLAESDRQSFLAATEQILSQRGLEAQMASADVAPMVEALLRPLQDWDDTGRTCCRTLLSVVQMKALLSQLRGREIESVLSGLFGKLTALQRRRTDAEDADLDRLVTSLQLVVLEILDAVDVTRLVQVLVRLSSSGGQGRTEEEYQRLESSLVRVFSASPRSSFSGECALRCRPNTETVLIELHRRMEEMQSDESRTGSEPSKLTERRIRVIAHVLRTLVVVRGRDELLAILQNSATLTSSAVVITQMVRSL